MKKLIPCMVFGLCTTVSFADAPAAPEAQEAKEAPQLEQEEADDEENLISSTTDIDFFSAYVWRGQVLSHKPVFQPAETLSFNFGDFGSIYANVWANFELSHRPGRFPSHFMGLNEIDYAAGYCNTICGIDIDVGHTWYTYPCTHYLTDPGEGGIPSVTELYLTLAYENDFLTPSFGAYWNYHKRGGVEENALYLEFGVDHAFELTEDLSLDLYAKTALATDSYMRSYTGYDPEDPEGGCNEPEFCMFEVGGKLEYAVTDWLKLHGTLAYDFQLSHTARHSWYFDGDDNGYNQILWGGLGATLEF